MKIKKTLIYCIGWFGLCASSLIAGKGNPETFFRVAEEPKELPEDRIYPHGRQFLFSFYSVGGGVNAEGKHSALPEEEVQREFERYKNAGLRVFGPQYEMNGRALEDAAKHGLQVIYDVRHPINFHADGGRKIAIDPEEIRKETQKLMSEAVKDDNVVIWYLRPEELRPWRPNEMKFLEVATTAIRENDPLGRPIWIYDPGHSSASRLASIAPWVDYLGKGMYTNYASMKESRIWVRWSMEQEMEAIRLIESDTVPLAVPELFHSARRGPLSEEDIALIPSWVRHDTYLSLVHGAKGVVVFSARKRPSLPEEVWESYYGSYFQVADELRGELALGQVFLFGEPRDEIQVDVVEGPEELEFLYASGGVKEPITYPSVSHLDVAYGQVRYLFVVNSANEPVRLAVGGMPFAAVQAESLFDAYPAFDIAEGEFEVTLAPLEVKVYKLSRR